MLQYWQAHESKWITPLRMLDVSAAWGCGELDGILPSGTPSRIEKTERLLTLARAVELFNDGKVNVRRRYRNLQVDELRPRWVRVMATRNKLKADKSFEEVVDESDKARRFVRAQILGEVEDEDASPVVSLSSSWCRSRRLYVTLVPFVSVTTFVKASVSLKLGLLWPAMVQPLTPSREKAI